MMKDGLEVVYAAILISLIIVALVAGIFFAIPAAIAAAILYGVYQKHHGPAAIAARAEAEMQALYQKALNISPFGFERFEEVVDDAIDDEDVRELGHWLYKSEGLLAPDPPPPIPNTIEGGRYRDGLNRYIASSYDSEKAERFVETTLSILQTLDRNDQPGLFEASRQRTPEEIGDLIMAFFVDDDFYRQLRTKLDQNLVQQNGVFPSEYSGTNCAWDYLKDTPLLKFEYASTSANWHNPENHTLVLAGSGAGKTTLFKHLIGHLLNDDVCVIVMDSQSQVIEELAAIDLPDDEIAWITPDHPLALNPFFAKPEDVADETFVNNAVSDLEFVIDKLIDAPMTPRQRTLFFHATNLVLTIPEGTIGTLLAVLSDPLAFSEHISAMDETTQRFFFEEMKGEGKKPSPYESTKTELRYRLDALLRNPTLRRALTAKENTFDVVTEMDERKLILIDTSIARLADQSATFGRFMIAQTLKACYQRVKAKNTDRPVVFFIDEAHEYFDDKLETMLLQARKANVGLVVATQDLARASRAGIADTLIGSTTTKIVSRIVTGDARRLAPPMKTTHEQLLDLPDHTFAFSSGGEEAVSITADPKALDDYEAREDLTALRNLMIKRYGPVTDPAAPNDPEGSNDEPDPSPDDGGGDDPNGAAPVATRPTERESDKPRAPKQPPRPKSDEVAAQKHTMNDNGDHDIKPSAKL
ncbi:MAG: DUF87 domain-containing protein [Pseudomonadota bacterium]